MARKVKHDLTLSEVDLWLALNADLPDARTPDDKTSDEIAAMRRCSIVTAERWAARQVAAGRLACHRVMGDKGRTRNAWHPAAK